MKNVKITLYIKKVVISLFVNLFVNVWMFYIIEDVSQTLMKTHKVLPIYLFLITYYKRVQNLSQYRYHTCRCFPVQCPVSVLSHSVESCGTSLTRPGIVFHNIIIVWVFIRIFGVLNQILLKRGIVVKQFLKISIFGGV